MTKRNRENEMNEENLLTAGDAFCAVDNTKCDGACQQKEIQNDLVHCGMVVPERFTLNKAARIRKGFQKARRDRYEREDD